MKIKKLLLYTFMPLALCAPSFAQSGQTIKNKMNSARRIVAQTVSCPSKEIYFYGVDSTNLSYQQTSYYYFNAVGNVKKVLAFDTTTSKYLSTTVINYDSKNREIFYAQIDTTSNDTTSAIS